MGATTMDFNLGFISTCGGALAFPVVPGRAGDGNVVASLLTPQSSGRDACGFPSSALLSIERSASLKVRGCLSDSGWLALRRHPLASGVETRLGEHE
jgi:hypothetical protein